MFGFGKKKEKKILKVGLIQGNRPLVERAIGAKEKVTLGTHDKNTFTIKSDRLPKQMVVFKPQGDRYLLTFLSGMSGKIAVKDNAMSLAHLLEKGVVETKNGQHSLSISNKTRGKLVFENCRLLFRFEDATS